MKIGIQATEWGFDSPHRYWVLTSFMKLDEAIFVKVTNKSDKQ